jgi:hypothetical protein
MEVCPASRGRREHVRFRRGKTIKPRKNWRGYFRVCLSNGGEKQRNFSVHRIVAEVFLGRSKKTVNHKDLDKENNHYLNLEYMTIRENLAHARGLKSWSKYKKTTIHS